MNLKHEHVSVVLGAKLWKLVQSKVVFYQYNETVIFVRQPW